ncbi:MAG: cysteine desulfurase [Calothrix sp. SM1_5_4]|nr:cysteine desulfurase [Calothrix sp. SM1_5_4]
MITQATEHKAVLEVCEAAQDWGAEVTVLPVTPEGLVRVEDVRAAIRSNTVLVSVMTANNEVGAIQPIRAIAELCRERKLVCHTDAAQSAGKLEFSLKDTPIDLISLSGHKLYGPKGVGALIVRPVNREFELKPILFGGEQERGLRPGTLNVAGIVGFGEACAAAGEVLSEECARLRSWQERIVREVRSRFPQVKLNGPEPGASRLCNNISFSFPDIHADDLMLELSGLAYSSGSACNSANPKPSHVLKAMGADDNLAGHAEARNGALYDLR